MRTPLQLTLLLLQGTYGVQGAKVNMTLTKIPILPYGHYRVLILGGLQGYEAAGQCTYLEVHLLPAIQI